MNDLLIENSLNGRDVNDIVSKGLRRKTLDFVQWPEITIHGHVVKASLTFCDASINVHGSQTLSLCRTVNPIERLTIEISLGIIYFPNKVPSALRPDLVESASHRIEEVLVVVEI
ncbi:hypothetical protein OUZ56_018989 [Daphnia magna]|uniref:Uncharacterized protein n=1 Tax=Daphnia magna TaxID=35525 RepID=A0ABQ9ZAB1_9CRUS|nr:hypothetical protein OUZ56_018989 [Daphnia magna]